MNFYVNVSQCCPSRSNILLGQYSHNTGILRNGGSQGGFRTFFKKGLENSSISVGMKAAGYQTMLAGKYLNGYPGAAKKRTYIPPGWDEWYVPVAGDPYSEYNYKLNSNGQVIRYGDKPEDFMVDVITEKAVAFIKNNSNKPIFMYLAPYAPHGPYTPAPRHMGMFKNLVMPKDPSFNESNVTDKPLYVQNLPLLTPEDEENIKKTYQKRLESLQSVDEMVARIVKTLEQTGQLSNTYIFFTSDNGFHLGQHRLTVGKLSPYDVDIRVPLIVRGPGISPNTQITEIAGNVDFAPTFAEIAGFTHANQCDGRSLLPLLHGQPPKSWRKAFLVEYWADQVGGESEIQNDGTLEPNDQVLEQQEESEQPENNGSITIPPYRGLYTSKYFYLEYATGEIELYNLINDPYQLNNIASTAALSFIDHFSKWLANLSKCKGSECYIADQLQ